MKRSYKLLMLPILIAIFLVSMFCISSASTLSYPKFKAFDTAGKPLNGGHLYTYKPGTTTPKVAYTNKAMTTQAANPIVLDVNGEAEVYLKGNYRLVLKNSTDSQTLWTLDNVAGIGSSTLVSIADYGDLASAVTAIGSTRVNLLIDQPQTLTANVIVPYTLSLQVINGGSITLGDYSLTINGPFTGSWASFLTNGTGRVTFGTTFSGVVYTDYFGADPTGLTTSATELNLAVAACPTGGTVRSSSGTYDLGTSTFVIDKDITVDFTGALITYSGSGIAVDVAPTGSDDVLLKPTLLGFDIEKSAHDWTTDSDTTSKGLRVHNVYEGWFERVTIKNFRYGIYVDAAAVSGSGKGSPYNTFFVTELKDNKYQFYLTGTDTGGVKGWVNANTVFGGRWWYSVDEAGEHIHGDATDYLTNGNDFISVSLEAQTEVQLGFNIAGTNYLIKPKRMECKAGSMPGTFSGNYNLLDARAVAYSDYTKITNTGDHNSISCRNGTVDEYTVQGIIEKFESDNAFHMFYNSHSPGSEVLKFFDTTGMVQRAGFTATARLNWYNTAGTLMGSEQLLAASNDTSSTVGTGEDTLYSYTVPADSLSTNGSLMVLAMGTKTGSAGNKTIKVTFGSETVTVLAATNDQRTWWLELTIDNLTATSQQVIWRFTNGADTTTGYSTMSVNTASNANLLVTAECANGGDMVSGRKWQLFRKK